MINKLSLIGYISSLFILIFMGVRYLWIYYDLSEVLHWVFTALTIAGFSYLYSEIIKLRNTTLAVEDYLADEKGNM